MPINQLKTIKEEPRTDLKTFVKWATYNLWNEDNKGS